MSDPLVAAAGLTVVFAGHGRGAGAVRAVDGVELRVERGQTLGLVGESGSGKTTVGRALLRALAPAAGEITYRFAAPGGPAAVDVARLGKRQLRPLRRHLQMIFQDPYASLSPRMTVRDIIAEPLVAQKLVPGREVDARVREIAARCQIDPDHLRRFPHAFSGGQRQRIGIARALVSRPQFVVCDEPVSSLDVSIRAEILNLLVEAQRAFGLTYLFVSHDLGVVEHVAHRTAVMYLGRIVEEGPTAALFRRPRHPYTAALLAAAPVLDPEAPFRPPPLAGEPPNPLDPPTGCAFHPRCPFAQPVCRTDRPALAPAPEDHRAACHFADALALPGLDAPIDPGAPAAEEHP